MIILFCSLSNYGNLYSALGIAQNLHRRGHKIVFLTGLNVSKTIKKAGFELVVCDEKDNPGFRIHNWGKPFAVAIQVKYIEYAIRKFVPDLIIGQHLTLGTRIIRRLYDIPIAILGLAAYLYPVETSLLLRSSQKKKERLVWQYQYEEMMRICNEACKILHRPPNSANYSETLLLGDLYLLRSVPELEGNIDILPERVHLIGDCLWEPPFFSRKLAEWLQQFDTSTKPLIYVQPGRSFEDPNFWSYLVDALKNRPVNVVASVGRMDGEIGDIPENFFVRKHLPQGLILPKASAVISSGHTTAVLGAITHGLPSLIIPHGSGTEDIAERCEKAGAAICLSPFQMTSESISKAVDQLLDCPNLQKNSQLLQQAFAKANDKNKIAQLLENLAFSREPVLNT